MRVLLTDALGQILAEDIDAALTLPPHDVSAMDGYAVRADDAGGLGKRFVLFVLGTLTEVGDKRDRLRNPVRRGR